MERDRVIVASLELMFWTPRGWTGTDPEAADVLKFSSVMAAKHDIGGRGGDAVQFFDLSQDGFDLIE